MLLSFYWFFFYPFVYFFIRNNRIRICVRNFSYRFSIFPLFVMHYLSVGIDCCWPLRGFRGFSLSFYVQQCNSKPKDQPFRSADVLGTTWLPAFVTYNPEVVKLLLCLFIWFNYFYFVILNYIQWWLYKVIRPLWIPSLRNIALSCDCKIQHCDSVQVFSVVRSCG